jgi:hypothetical protein
MSKRWTLEEDLFLAEYDGMDANFLASHDLGRKSKDAGSRRMKSLKASGVWDHICAYMKARDTVRCYHTIAFSTSDEARMIAAETLRDIGADLNSEARQWLATADDLTAKAERYLTDYDRKNSNSV